MKIDIYNTNKKYNIIYADPPWKYKVWSQKTGLGRSAESHYTDKMLSRQKEYCNKCINEIKDTIKGGTNES